jgi:hypothetical protein
MNYKIAFKTWLKHAKKSLKAVQEGRISGNMTPQQIKAIIETQDAEAKGNFHNVDIEVSDYCEFTSEEEAENKFGPSHRKNTIARSFFGKSIMDANKQPNASAPFNGKSFSSKKKLARDQLEIFGSKLKEKIMKESAKKPIVSWSSLK